MAIFPIANEHIFYVGMAVLVILVAYELQDSTLFLWELPDPPQRKLDELEARDEPINEEELQEPSATKVSLVEDAVSAHSVHAGLHSETTAPESANSSVNLSPSDGAEPEEGQQLGDIDAIHVDRNEESDKLVLEEEGLSALTGEKDENAVDESIWETARKIMDPLPDGCSPDSENARIMAQYLPELTLLDITRFLVARKGDVKLATEMAQNCGTWRRETFPLKRSELEGAMRTGCFFPYRCARDGSPCVYMRGAFYDNTQATAEQFVLAAAHAIETCLKQHPKEVNVTVVCHTANVPGAPNKSADINFIKQFVKVLSDNYPERLRRIILYPFPWFGRAIWSIVKVFIDKRTQDKAILIADTGSQDLPAELTVHVDPEDIPICCGGNCEEPIMDLISTLNDPSTPPVEVEAETEAAVVLSDLPPAQEQLPAEGSLTVPPEETTTTSVEELVAEAPVSPPMPPSMPSSMNTATHELQVIAVETPASTPAEDPESTTTLPPSGEISTTSEVNLVS